MACIKYYTSSSNNVLLQWLRVLWQDRASVGAISDIYIYSIKEFTGKVSQLLVYLNRNTNYCNSMPPPPPPPPTHTHTLKHTHTRSVSARTKSFGLYTALKSLDVNTTHLLLSTDQTTRYARNRSLCNWSALAACVTVNAPNTLSKDL